MVSGEFLSSRKSIRDEWGHAHANNVKAFVDRLETYSFLHSHILVENAHFWVDSLCLDSASNGFLFIRLHQAKQFQKEARLHSALVVFESLKSGIEAGRPVYQPCSKYGPTGSWETSIHR